MKRLVLFVAALVVISAVAVAAEPAAPPSGPAAVAHNPVPSYLQGISVTVLSGNSQGSGTLVSRMNDKGEVVSFVLTAAHVIDNLRYVRQVVNPDGSTKRLIEFKDPRIVAERYQDGRRVGEQTLDCKVIKYSDADYGEDLALLMIRLRDSYPASASARFPDRGYIPSVGSDLSHCGSLLGKFGSSSYTTGVLSQTGRLLEGKGAKSSVFDQITAVAFPGSSGGGVYLQADGMYIGMLTQGTRTQGFNFIVPIRRIGDWAEKAGIGWILNSSEPMPPMEEILLIPVEDEGNLQSDSGGRSFSWTVLRSLFN